MSESPVVAVQLPSSNVTTPPNELPNLAVYTTQGFNLKNGNFASNTIFQQTFTQKKTVHYSIDGKSQTFELPDQISYDPTHNGTYQSISSSIIQSQEDYSNYVSSSVSVGGSYEIASAHASASTIFSQNISISNSQTYGLNFGGAVVFSVARQLPTAIPDGYLTPAFIAALNGLSSSSTQTEFAAFFDAWGTHYLQSGCFGGSYVMLSSIATSSINTMTQSQVSVALTAGFNEVVASGSLSVSALQKADSAVSSFSSSSSFSFFTMGGEPSVQIDDFITSISADPILLMNPSVAPEAVVRPMTDLMTPAASAAMVQAYQQALALYLNPEMSVVGAATAVSPSTIVCAASDGLLTGWAYMQTDGDRGQFTLSTDSSLNPTTVRAQGSMHQYSGNGIIVPFGNGITPVRKGDYYNAVFEATAINPAFSAIFTPLNFPPTISLGTWSAPTTFNSSNILTATAETDLFVCVNIQEQNDGDRGYVIGSIGDTVIATASMHWFMGDDIHIPQSSFLLPVPAGSTYSIAYTVTAINPQVTIYTIPIETSSGGVLQAPVPLAPNMVNTAPTDGFVVASLNATANGSRGTVTGYAGQTAGQAPTQMVGATSAHYFSNIDCYVPYNSITFPVTRGAQHNSIFNNTAIDTTCTVYWFGMSV